MIQDSPFRKIFDGVATREQMFQLFNRVPDAPVEDRISGRAYANQWFAIDEQSYEYMLELLPPLFMRAGMFAMSEFKVGSVTSVFFEIDGLNRWFHGYCDLGDRRSSDAMRAAIIAHEKAALAGLTRAQKLDLIWSRTHSDFRGVAGDANPDAWPAEHIGKRTITVFEPGAGTVLKLLENLTDQEIADRLPKGPTISAAGFRPHRLLRVISIKEPSDGKLLSSDRVRDFRDATGSGAASGMLRRGRLSLLRPRRASLRRHAGGQKLLRIPQRGVQKHLSAKAGRRRSLRRLLRSLVRPRVFRVRRHAQYHPQPGRRAMFRVHIRGRRRRFGARIADPEDLQIGAPVRFPLGRRLP
ncbi:DUF1419 domain-containing protein [Sphingobium aquiterrae]|uniref:DUF1419 domain-containing protein n=1 Tax=Sphingobium aquiterrae TaxID=2038656 RepID=UPI00301B38AD